MFTVREVAELLRIGESTTVYQLIAQGKLAHHRIGVGKGAIRISQSDIDAFLESCHVEHSSEESRDEVIVRKSTLKHIRL